jgi:hypothetical protein
MPINCPVNAYTVSGTGSIQRHGISQVCTSQINNPEELVQFPFHKTTLVAKRESKTGSPCHGNGEATKSLDALLILMKMSC